MSSELKGYGKPQIERGDLEMYKAGIPYCDIYGYDGKPKRKIWFTSTKIDKENTFTKIVGRAK